MRTGRVPRLGSMVLLLLVLTATTAAVAGCKPPDGAVKCGWMDDTADATGRTAVLVDVSNSTRSGNAAVQAPDYAEATREQVASAAVRRDTVSVAAFSGTQGDLEWKAKNRSADWKKDTRNKGNQEERREEAIDCLGGEVAEAQDSPARGSGSDILRAIDNAATWLREGKGDKHLIVATDGLVNTGCANLLRSSFSDQREITAIADQCAKGELRPGLLDGVSVEFVGVGHPSGEQPVPTVEQVKWLGDLWRKLCATGNGRCSVSTASATGEGDSGAAVPPSSGTVDEAVTFGSRTVTYTVSAAQFDTDQTTLKPSADSLLLTIAVQIRNDYSTVNVFGYADRRGSAERNKELSVRRAQAVADVLRRHSVRGVVVRGMGVTEECPYNIEVPATASDDERLQCFRRVDIVAS